MNAVEDPEAELTRTELRDLRRFAGFMVPTSAEYGVPGADDEAIFADIVRSLGRDRKAVPRIELVAPEAKLMTSSAIAASADITVPSFWAR